MPRADSATIVALSTPPGVGGIAVVRLTGSLSREVAAGLTGLDPKSFRPRFARFAPVRDPEGEEIDRAIVTFYQQPHSYTGEDVLEISVHGGMVIPARIIDACLALGCVPAEPGEFTRRAFLNGKMDLSQAEAVADVIAARTALSQKVSHRILTGRFSELIHTMKQDLFRAVSLMEAELDFGDDVPETPSSRIAEMVNPIQSTGQALLDTYSTGRLLKEGAIVSIIGRPNVGKSSLLNALLSEERVIVTDQPGTTRDAVEVSYQIDGLPLRFVDTAGITDTADPVETRGIEFSHKFIHRSDLVLWVFEATDTPEGVYETASVPFFRAPHLTIINKADLLTPHQRNRWSAPLNGDLPPLTVSALEKSGIDVLVDRIRATLFASGRPDHELILTNARHKAALDGCTSNLQRAIDLLQQDRERDLVAFELREALGHLDAILGITTADDILNNIFATFCIGK
ncbi:MAG: tRNA uridine-5-carboxymethylaminomethyl(34) synthesis GTPase MnmE [Fidelibacterota bacterium]